MKTKKKNKAQKKKSPLSLLTKILVVITVIVFLAAGFRIKEYSRDYSYNYQESDYIWSLQNNHFGEAYYTAIRDMCRGKTYSKNVEECRALVFYYEQSVLEKAYRENGQAEKADEFAAKKEEYAKQLGSFASKAKDVDAQLAN